MVLRGYPTVIFINPRGQKFGEAKYMKGGPKVFLECLTNYARPTSTGGRS